MKRDTDPKHVIFDVIVGLKTPNTSHLVSEVGLRFLKHATLTLKIHRRLLRSHYLNSLDCYACKLDKSCRTTKTSCSDIHRCVVGC
jgi:hypothetical protein